MSVLVALRAEQLKIRRTASIYLALVAAAFTPFTNTLDLLVDGIGQEHRKVIFNELFTTRFGTTGALAFPIFIIFICTLLPQVEYKNNTWKQVLTSPQTKLNVFAAKFISIQLLIFLFMGANVLLVLASAVILHVAEPSLNVLRQPLNGFQIITIFLNSYAALLGITAIQFWLGLRFRNFIVSLGIGIGLWFTGTILAIQMQPNVIEYFPYSFHMYVGFPKFQPADLTLILANSVGYAALFLLIGYLNFKKSRIW